MSAIAELLKQVCYNPMPTKQQELKRQSQSYKFNLHPISRADLLKEICDGRVNACQR